jgi:PadR family transcriptional regulator, regulatory protein AphA
MTKPSPHTFGLLGMLAVRPWTSYELTRQVRRSLRFMWQTSEGHLYREQGRLVTLGWARVEEERAGRRTRKRYSITKEGRKALAEWLSTEPQEPTLQIEGIMRTFFADQGSPPQLVASMKATSRDARAMLEELLGFVDDYLAQGGPMSMIEAGRSGPGTGREEFRGRLMYPERLHVVAVSIDVITQLLETIDRFFAASADEVSSWSDTTDPALAPRTRQRLESIRDRGALLLDPSLANDCQPHRIR